MMLLHACYIQREEIDNQACNGKHGCIHGSTYSSLDFFSETLSLIVPDLTLSRGAPLFT